MEEVDHLAHERSTAQFDVEAMKVVWAGSKHVLDVSDRMARLVASDPEFRKDNRVTLGRKELFKNTLRKTAHAWKRINELCLTGFAELSVDLLEMAIAHCQLVVVPKFIEKRQQDIPGEGVKHQLQVLCNIYCLHLLHRHLGDFLSTSCITPEQGLLANEQLMSLYSQVYPALYQEAWKEPLSDSVVPDGYYEYVRPLINSSLGSQDCRPGPDC